MFQKTLIIHLEKLSPKKRAQQNLPILKVMRLQEKLEQLKKVLMEYMLIQK